jgi:hypothetical protein
MAAYYYGSDDFYRTPQALYGYDRSYPSTIDPSQTWTPINPRTVNRNNPPPPETYMYGEQYGRCFVHRKPSRGVFSKFGQWLKKLLRGY